MNSLGGGMAGLFWIFLFINLFFSGCTRCQTAPTSDNSMRCYELIEEMAVVNNIDREGHPCAPKLELRALNRIYKSGYPKLRGKVPKGVSLEYQKKVHEITWGEIWNTFTIYRFRNGPFEGQNVGINSEVKSEIREMDCDDHP